MRESLFRGKRKDNGEWICGDLLQDVESGICAIVSYVNLGGNIHDLSESCIFAVIPETVGQYTGHTDKNGVMIFEGDIVHVKARSCSFTGSVMYWSEEARYVCKTKSGMRYAICNKFEFEVLGNIYDNPEFKEDTE